MNDGRIKEIVFEEYRVACLESLLVPMVRSALQEEQAKNKYAICTASIGKKEGTQERSKWSEDAMKRYERCKADIDEGVVSHGES